MNTRVILVVVLAAGFLSCEVPFSPRGPFEPDLVVYSVLSNTRSSQFVRVYHTYSPPELDPYAYRNDSVVSDASVRIFSGGDSHDFRDTVIHRETVAGADSLMHVFVADPFPLVRGTTYTLEVSSPSFGTAQSEVIVPTPPGVGFPSRTLIEKPPEYHFSWYDPQPPFTFIFGVGLSPHTVQYLARIFIDFDVVQGSDTLHLRWQIPYIVYDTSLVNAYYRGFEFSDGTSVDLRYPTVCYVTILTRIFFLYRDAVRYKALVVEVTQIGRPLYEYSTVVNGFADELSLRLDQPDHSNITGGFGLFGAWTRDEIVRPYPPGWTYYPWPQVTH